MRGRAAVPWILGHCLDSHDPVGSAEGILPLFPAYVLFKQLGIELMNSRVHPLRNDLLLPLQAVPT
jgi:hypothetical protein